MQKLFQEIVSIMSVVMALSGSTEAADAKSVEIARVQACGSILIKAPPSVVWKAIHTERNTDPDIAYSKILESTGDTLLLEQKFLHIPILGTVIAVTKQTEHLDQRIDYRLVRSDKLKALEGSWELTPVKGGRNTMLQLRSRLDIGVPFSAVFVKGATQKKLERRIANVKCLAEREQERNGSSAEP